jgi:hypothetical protein
MRGVAAMLRWSAQREDVAVALASFRTHAMRAHAEDTSAYELTLANASSADVAAHVLIDLYRRDDASHPQGHYAFFEKTLLVRRQRALAVLITYDWQRRARFVVDGVGLAADVFWRGPCDDRGTYHVHAVLLGPGDVAAQRLSLVQELG